MSVYRPHDFCLARRKIVGCCITILDFVDYFLRGRPLFVGVRKSWTMADGIVVRYPSTVLGNLGASVPVYLQGRGCQYTTHDFCLPKGKIKRHDIITLDFVDYFLKGLSFFVGVQK